MKDIGDDDTDPGSKPARARAEERPLVHVAVGLLHDDVREVKTTVSSLKSEVSRFVADLKGRGEALGRDIDDLKARRPLSRWLTILIAAGAIGCVLLGLRAADLTAREWGLWSPSQMQNTAHAQEPQRAQ